MLTKMKDYRIFQRAVLMMGILLFLCAGKVMAASPDSENRVLKVAFPVSQGISEIDEYGEYKGLLVDYLNEIAKYTNWEYEYIEVDAEDLIDNFLKGQYDLMGGTFYSAGWEKYFAYPQFNTGRSMATLLGRKDDDSLQSYNVASLNGKTIGVYEKAEDKIRYLKEFLTSNDLDCKLHYYAKAEMGEEGNLFDQLRSGEVDMILDNETESAVEFRRVASFQSQPYYIVTTVENDEVLDELNMALGHILESDPEFGEEIYDVNFPDTKLADMQLNEEELSYVSRKKTVSVAVVKSWHPLFCLGNDSEHHDGLIPDVLNQISEFSGLEFTYVYGETYADTLKMVQNQEADIVGVYLDSDSKAFSQGLAMSQSYIDMNNIVLKNKSVSYPDEGLVGGILDGRGLPADIPASEVKIYPNCHEMLEAVNKGEVDFIYGLSATLEQEMQNHRYLNVVPVTRLDSNANAAFALARPIEPELLTILNKSINNMSTNETITMLDRNLVSVGYTNLTLQELIFANPVAFLVIFAGVLVLIVLIVLLTVRSRMKNSVMESELKAAQAKSQAKSEFLSRMSHEIRTPMNAIVGLTDLICMEKGAPERLEKNLKKIRSSSQYLLSLINDILDMSQIENGKMEIEQENFSIVHMLEDLEEMMGTQAEQKALMFSPVREISHEWLVGDAVRLRQVLTNLLSNSMKFTPSGGAVSLEVNEISSDENVAAYKFTVKDTGVGISQEDQDRIFVSFEQLGSSMSRSAGTGLGLPISQNIVQLMGGKLQVNSSPGEGSEFYMTLEFPLGTEVVTRQMSRKTSLQGVRILLAEDNDLNAEIAQEILAIEGIKIQRASDGQEAVDLFMESEPGEYQMILMDIRMPVKDGLEAARDIRASGRPDANVPIIAMTANSFREDEEAARKSGMTGFVPKPVDSQYLFAVLRENI